MQKRAVAIATALALVCVGLFARHHAAEAAHAREHSGQIVHAQELADHHVVGANAHLHESANHDHAGNCSLLAVLHAPLLETRAVAIAFAAAQATAVLAPIAAPSCAAIAGYRIAPKTSPPFA
jgi:hypothetical protein